MRKRYRRLAVALPALPLAGIVLCASVAAPPKAKTSLKGPATQPPNSASALYKRDIQPLVQKYCVACHSSDAPSGGADLSRDRTIAALITHRSVWERAADNLSGRSMPPRDMPQPTDAEREKIASFIQSTLSKADCELHDPGRVTLRRLNRAEYNNTVRDLTGLDIHPADDFPSDDVGYGFDNIGDVLSMTPLHLEKYLSAAGKVARAAIVAPEDRKARAKLIQLPASAFQEFGESFPDTNGHALYTNGEASIDANFPSPGRYTMRVKAWEQHAGHDYAQMAVRFDYQTLTTVKVMARQDQPGVYEVPLNISKAGAHRLSVAYLNNYKDLTSTDPTLRGDRNLILQGIDLARADGGPIDNGNAVATVPESQKRLIPVLPKAKTEAAYDAATRQDMVAFARRAYRRPPTADEIDRLMRVARLSRARGGSFERGIQVALQAALVSPAFLFRVERDPDPNNPRASHPVSDYELATRLSYFLWSSTPDDRLLGLAAQNKLHIPRVLDAEALRMLKDPRAKALCDNFAAQWLTLRNLSQVTPDTAVFPQFNEELRVAMRRETDNFFNYVVAQDRPVTDFLDCDYTFLNEPLAKLYGISGVTGPEFRKVVLKDGRRGGVLTQASVLTVTSNPTRTSPVKRGKWVMENLLGATIPPPPPNVPQLADDKKEPLTGTLRQRMEQHRKNPACASCHQRMDDIGFGLENYNPIGQWRTLDSGAPIDASGVLPGGGASFKNPVGLKKALKGKTPQFVRNLTEKLLTYALGRGVESYDRCNVTAMADAVTEKHYKFSAIVLEIVNSQPFQYRHGDSGAGTPSKVALLEKR